MLKSSLQGFTSGFQGFLGENKYPGQGQIESLLIAL